MWILKYFFKCVEKHLTFFKSLHFETENKKFITQDEIFFAFSHVNKKNSNALANVIWNLIV